MKVMRSVRGRITTKLIYLTLSFSPALPAFRAQRFPTRECGKWLDFAAHDTAPHDRDTVHKWKLVHSKLGEIAVPSSKTYRFMPEQSTRLVPASPRAASPEPNA